MRVRALAAAVTTAIVAPVLAQPVDITQSRNAQTVYFECARQAGAVYAAAGATPSDVADAAQSKCEGELHAIGITFRRELRAQLSGPNAEIHANEGARRAVDSIRADMRNALIRWTIESRADAPQPAAREAR